MATLEQVWLDSQSDLDAPALMKMADGSQVEVTKTQLMAVLHSMKPGQSITVGGLNITVGENDQLEVTSTTSPVGAAEASDRGFAKAAQSSGWNRPSFGAALQGLYILGGGDDDL
jgi:hypothetical protein